MGFPIIMYLSKAKVERYWNRKGSTSLRSIKPNLSFMPNPQISVQADFEKGQSIDWPPQNSLDIAIKIEKQLKRDNQIGTIEDFLNRKPYLCYKMKWKIMDLNKRMHLGEIVGQGTNWIFVPDGSDEKVLIDVSYEKIAGASFEGGKWNAWESGAIHLFNDVVERGYEAIGLFTYEGEAENYFARCGILYFASSHTHRGFYQKPQIKDLILNDYLS